MSIVEKAFKKNMIPFCCFTAVIALFALGLIFSFVPDFFGLDVLHVILFVSAGLSFVRLFFDFSKKQAKLIETIVVGLVAGFLVYSFIQNLIFLIQWAQYGSFNAGSIVILICTLFFAGMGFILILGNVLSDIPDMMRLVAVGVSAILFILYMIFGLMYSYNFGSTYAVILTAFSIPLIYIGNFFVKEGAGIKLGKESEKTASQADQQNDAQ